MYILLPVQPGEESRSDWKSEILTARSHQRPILASPGSRRVDNFDCRVDIRPWLKLWIGFIFLKNELFFVTQFVYPPILVVSIAVNDANPRFLSKPLT